MTRVEKRDAIELIREGVERKTQRTSDEQSLQRWLE
jgi:hypothetical protein